MIELILAATATAVATGVGVIPVVLLGAGAQRLRPLLLGVAAGTMTVASLAGLLPPAFDEGTPAEVLLGLALGVAFLVAARRRLGARPQLRPSQRTSVLVFAVLLVHSLPEGFAIGTAYASETAGLGFFIVLAIAIQNVPEGTSIAIPMALAGEPPARQAVAAVASSIPQPVGAVIAYLAVAEVSALLPVSFGFAAGAMLALVAVEMLPPALRERLGPALGGFAVGAVAMLLLSVALGV